MGRLTAAMPVIIEPNAEVRAMSNSRLLNALVRSPAEAKPCTRRDADQVEWLRPAASLLADRRTAVHEEMRARRLCAGCAVMSECLELSLRDGPVEGVQGGATERSRQTLRRRRAHRALAGTEAAQHPPSSRAMPSTATPAFTPPRTPAGSGSPTTSR